MVAKGREYVGSGGEEPDLSLAFKRIGDGCCPVGMAAPLVMDENADWASAP
ncbi:hypothetical protein [Croceicoccus mobilis]|uniref:Uncharacterized protein n=1 Tax=Croceicoccus mobilis TaxID=1703339 RepID=A0A917DYC9_9SPHN|nr:hypothetical protein [Croceicoccus mobilis]GGD83295.1 hypothetical protein GCM10010990_36730 [Croceicoccus mobilis]